jgi:hypothetical protein
MIYSLSLYKGKKIIEDGTENYQQYYEDLKELFSVIKLGTLKDLKGV